MAIEYRCPVCGDAGNLSVEATRVYDLIQSERSTVSLDKEMDRSRAYPDPEWDGSSVMYCSCGHEGLAHEFIIDKEG